MATVQPTFPGYYRIFNKISSLHQPKCLGIRDSSNFTGLVIRDYDPADESQYWYVLPLAGSTGFYLANDPVSLYYRTAYFTGERKQIRCDSLDVKSDSFVIACDDVGDGWVAINNHNGSLVFDVESDNPSDGTRVVGYPWNKGDNQRWRFVPHFQANRLATVPTSPEQRTPRSA